jgi:hypothetical protein
LEAVASYEPENVPAVTSAVWQLRTTTFVELLRWSGMALIDAVQRRPALVDDEGGKKDSIPIAIRSVRPLARIRRNRQRPPSNGSIERAPSTSPGLHAFVKTRLR